MWNLQIVVPHMEFRNPAIEAFVNVNGARGQRTLPSISEIPNITNPCEFC